MGQSNVILWYLPFFEPAFFPVHFYVYSISDEDREELDTSTESKGIETKEQEVDTMTDEEDNSLPNKKKGIC